MNDNQSTRALDTAFHSLVGQFTGGLSPSAMITAGTDWWIHMLGSPNKQADLLRFGLNRCDHDLPSDPRFSADAWNNFPYTIIAQNFLTAQNWWNAATSDMVGVDPRHLQIVNFAARQWLDMMSPSNFALTNPEVLERVGQEGGQNLIRGLQYWIEDFNRLTSRQPSRSSAFHVGEDLAVTPGDVVMRNELVELIRYHPTANKLHPEPILIVPAWIMKYYVLDLTAQRSLVAYLRDQGFEVFILSWRNPDASDAELSLQDYIDKGVRASIDHISKLGAKQLHAVGYCLGGTLLSAVSAAMARDGDDRLRSMSLLASQVDFSEPGELSLFINESQVAFLEDLMATHGYLTADQMAGAFQLLRSNDLIWSRVVRHYLLGERTADNPLMAWNADATRMPAKMHSEYLRQLFLNNDLAKGRFKVDGRSIALTDMRCPMYCVGTETDHVSPWTSVYRLLLLTDTDVTFVLTNGGHNGGILSEPGHKGRHFRHDHKTEGDRHLMAQDWFDQADLEEGSWWPHWIDWLKDKSGAPVARRSKLGKTLGAAPGLYVHG